MNHTDPIADMLTRIRNALQVHKKEVTIPRSRIKLEIAKILKAEGYVADFKVEEEEFPPQIVVRLKYHDKNRSVIDGLKRISTPGKRVYATVENLPQVLDGLGMAIISTPQGLLTGTECKKRHLGGEVLLHVW